MYSETLFDLLGGLMVVILLLWLGNAISYRWIKRQVLSERCWDYNICCGTTDGGGINADIVRHGPIPRFERVDDVTRLPHRDGAFDRVLCSHTLEHLDDPDAMYRELRRVGRRVTILVPPLWDLAGVLNPLEHRVIFLTLRSRHDQRLPRWLVYRPGRWLQSVVGGQRIRADRHGLGDWLARTGGRWQEPLRQRVWLVPVLWGTSALLLIGHSGWGIAMAPFAVLAMLNDQIRPLG